MIYLLSYEESEILGYRIFNDYDRALKEFLKHNISEIKSVLEDDDYEVTKCTLEIKKLEDNEYETIKEYEYEHFSYILENKEDPEAFMQELDTMLENNTLTHDVLDLFPL